MAEYDRRHGNHFLSTAKSYMRNDIRYAKDISADLKHVAQQITKTQEYSQSELVSARKMIDVTANAMEVLVTKGRNYDETNGRATGVKGVIQDVVGGPRESSDKGGQSETDVTTDNWANNTPDTVEEVVKSTLRDNFDLSVLIRPINAAEEVLTPSIIEKAKEAVHNVSDVLMDKQLASNLEGHSFMHMATP